MKETHLYYDPQAGTAPLGQLPADEARHAVSVMRTREGEAIRLTDGRGHLFTATVTATGRGTCAYQLEETEAVAPTWQGGIHLAVAPTKNMDRIEWLTEKATEIGLDSLTPIRCHNSERTVVKAERLERVAVSAMKQSHKARLPRIDALTPVADLIRTPFDGQKFIAHCLTPADVAGDTLQLTTANFLGDLIRPEGDCLVLIGPEGDFTPAEVSLALENGFTPVSLGESRLRTETAALVAVHLMYLAKRRRTEA